jgi:hypothetical protein
MPYYVTNQKPNFQQYIKAIVTDIFFHVEINASDVIELHGADKPTSGDTAVHVAKK